MPGAVWRIISQIALLGHSKVREITQLAKAFCTKTIDKAVLVLKPVYARINKKGDTSFFLLIIKGAAAFLFLLGIVNGVYKKDFNTIIPAHSAGQEEVQVGLLDAQERTGSVFASSRFTPVEISENNEEGAGTGGSADPTFPTVQGSTFLAMNPLSIPDKPAKNRREITTYTVKPGDTATGIASSFGIKLNTLLWSNHFSSPNYIKPGEELIILPYDGVLHEVKSGDTLSGIASAYQAETKRILEANEIDSPKHIFIGQTIIIPEGVKPTPVARSSSSGSRSYTPTYSSQPNLGGYFARPASGRITQGLHLKNAVDIGNSCWTPIAAAASGTVNVASSGGYGRFSNGGYGGYVLVNHPNGTRTLYAHMIRVEVSAGQYVSQGQIIGRMGGKPGTFGAGRSTGCHLHWEVHGARNPLAY